MISFSSHPSPFPFFRFLPSLVVLLTLLSLAHGDAQEIKFETVAEPSAEPSAEPPTEPAAESGDGIPPNLKGFRFSTKRVLDVPGAESLDPARDLEVSPDSMRLGKATDIGTLPPELMEEAQKGALAVADKNWEEAKKIYLEMVKAAPENAIPYANLGVAEHQLGNLLAASGNLSRSLELSPHIARNWQTLGLINYERGELALAISNLTRAIYEAPEDAESRLILAAVVRDYGWTDAAVTELQRAVELDPKLTAAHYNLAITYLGMKPPRIELARRHYFAAIDLGMPPSAEIEDFLKQSK